MTNLEAIAAQIEPFSISDDAYEKAFIDACAHFSVSAYSDDDYDADMVQVVALASMCCLNSLRVLTSENIGGISQSYDTNRLETMIKGIAKRAGLSASLVLDSDSGEDPVVGYTNCW